MPYATYRVTFKSKENRGQGRPNTLELQFANDADAIQFGHNVAMGLGGALVSVDLVLTSNYNLPYPAGTDDMVRVAAWLSPYEYTFRVYDVPAGFTPATRTAALIAAGFKFPSPDRTVFRVPNSMNLTEFHPGQSV